MTPWVANVFVVDDEQLSKAVKLAMDELAKADPKAADEWAQSRICSDSTTEEKK